jgi:AraC-like DNA-binding protein
MSDAVYENIKNIGHTGIQYKFFTVPGGYTPLHWHEELELLYALNGEATVVIEGKSYHLPHRHFLVIPPNKIHSTFYQDFTTMFLCIHISTQFLQNYMPDSNLYEISCNPLESADQNFVCYKEICDLLDKLTRSYIEASLAFPLEIHGLILQVYARLIRDFSRKITAVDSTPDLLSMQRVRSVITYVEEHYQEPISLADVTSLLGISAEYFCRFFKKNMGIPFLKYVNEVRAAHVYHDLIHTDLSIAEVMEKNGFTNQKLFNRTFRELYGCTPSSVRKA